MNADDLCITAQYQSFKKVEEKIERALDNLAPYYKINIMRAYPGKTQVTAFHLRNKETNSSLQVVWNETEPKNTAYLKYIGVSFDRSLCYKQHIQYTKLKVATRNNLLTKLATSKWGENPGTIRMTALALSCSTAEYATPVCARSPHAKTLDP